MNSSDFTGTSSKMTHVQTSFGKYIFICNDQCEYISWRYDISNNDNIYYSMQTFLHLLITIWLAKFILTNCMFEDIERRPIFLQQDIGTNYVMCIYFHYTHHYLYVYKTISNCRKYGMIDMDFGTNKQCVIGILKHGSNEINLVNFKIVYCQFDRGL